MKLTNARIKAFRTLVDPIEIPFAAKPGVTIFVGPNGSGKSTVLDAIEWALTGSVSRIPPFGGASPRRAPNVYRSLGSNVDPEVELTFETPGEPPAVIRGPRSTAESSSILRRADAPWNQIQSVEAALLWTHFSSQRSTARLGHDDDDAVLKALAAPSGLDKFRGLDIRLWGSETRKALKELQREVENERHQHAASLAYFDRFSELPTDDDHSGLRRRISQLLGTIALDVPGDMWELDFEPSDIPTVIRRFDDVEQLLIERQTQLEIQHSEVRHRTVELREATLRKRRLEVDFEAAQQAVESTSNLLARREAVAQHIAHEMAASSEARKRLDLERNAVRDAIFIREQRAEHLTKSSQLDKRVVELRSQIVAVEESLTLLSQLTDTSTRIRAGNALLELEEFDGEDEDRPQIERHRESLAGITSDLRRDRDVLVAERDRLRTALSADAERFDTLRELVSSIASHVHAHDTKCPVCAASYPPGELLSRARAVLDAPDTGSHPINERMAEINQKIGSVTGQLQVAERRQEEVIQRLAARDRRSAERTRLEQVFGAAWSTDILEMLIAQRLDLLERLALGEDEDLREHRAQLDARRKLLARVLVEEEGEYNRSVAAYTSLLQRTVREGDDAQLKAELRQVESRREATQSMSESMLSEFRHAKDLAENAEGQQKAATDRCSAIEADLTQARDRETNLKEELSSLTAGQDEANFVQANQDQSVRISLAIERLSLLRHEMAETMRLMPSSERLSILRTRYTSNTPNASLAQIRTAIEQRLAECGERLQALTDLGDRLNQRARFRRQIDHRVRGTALKPWNDLFRSVYASLAGSLGDTLEWIPHRVDMRYTEMESHATPQVNGEALDGWVPGHYFSEGQLAALQISAMITASVLMPWSRWPALLLDDPLQHADVIKVGAFADLIRSLSEDKGHQIVLTTHDTVQADFIANKFLAAGLSAQIHRFERRVPPLFD